MLAFITLVGRNGQRVDPALIEHLEREAPDALPFAHERTICWKNSSGSVHLLGWEAFTDIAGIGSHWFASEHGLTAFTGYCWPLETGWNDARRTWAEQLQRWLGDRDPATVRDGLFGQFNLLHLDATGRGAVVSDVFSSGPLFHAELDDCTVFSNRSGLAALAVTPAGQKPVRSPLGAGWMIFDTLIYSDETGYLAVEHLPHGAWIRIDPDRGAKSITPARTTLEAPAASDLPRTYEGLVPLMVEEARAHMHIVSRLPVDSIELRLSGGKDSRILAAAVMDTGLRDRIGFMTFGPPEKSDPLVAGTIAREFGLRWRLDERRGRPAATDIDMVATHTFLTEGMLSGWDTTWGLTPHNGVTLTGAGGDFIGWRQESTMGLLCKTRQDVLDQLMARAEFDRWRLLLPEAKRWYLDGIVEWVDQQLDRGQEPRHIRAHLLRESKMRGVIGLASAVEPSLWINSYSAPIWFRASFQLPPEQRSGFRFYIDIIEQLCPRLLDFPLANKTWSPESCEHRADRARFAALEAAHGPGGDAGNWRVVNWQAYRPLIAEHLLDRGNPLYHVLDYPRMERMLQRGALSTSQMRSVYSALTAALWLGGDENRRKIARPG